MAEGYVTGGPIDKMCAIVEEQIKDPRREDGRGQYVLNGLTDEQLRKVQNFLRSFTSSEADFAAEVSSRERQLCRGLVYSALKL